MMGMLRGYQQEMLDRLYVAWNRYRSVMVQMPTGTGKTVLMGEVIRRKMAEVRRKRSDGILIVAHRRELLDQIRGTVKYFGIDMEKEHLVVESIQKLSRLMSDGRSKMEEVPFSPSLVIIDEAHHALAKTYRGLWERWPEAKVLGLTATPCRLSGEAFTDLFDVLLQSWSIQTFIDKGWLSDFEYVSAAPDNPLLEKVHGLSKRGADGDYQTKEMVSVMDCEESIAHLYRTYAAFAWGKKGIVYAINREHAVHIAGYYAERGVRCAVIDSKTPAKERADLVLAYREGMLVGEGLSLGTGPLFESSTSNSRDLAPVNGDGESSTSNSRDLAPVNGGPRGIDVLVNVDIFGEGFDVPEVEFIQLARPTLSLSKYLQQVGRGMRISKGKEAVTILDNVGLYHVFGLPTDERNWGEMFLGRLAGKGVVGEEPMLVVDEGMLVEGGLSLGTGPLFESSTSNSRNLSPVNGDGESSTSNSRDLSLGTGPLFESSTSNSRDLAPVNVLVNLEMVRVKRRGEARKGVEVFLQGGKYGVMMNGRVTCPAAFERVTRLERGSGFFAIGTYPYYIYKNRQTVIDNRGIDLKASLYGKVTQDEDFFVAKDIRGMTVWFDGIGRKEYRERPRTSKFRNVDLIDRGDGWYSLRRQALGMGQVSFRLSDVLYNDHLVIVKDMLLVKGDQEHVYKIMAYLGDSVLAGNGDLVGGTQQIFYDGRLGERFRRNERVQGMTLKPDLRKLRLRGNGDG